MLLDRVSLGISAPSAIDSAAQRAYSARAALCISLTVHEAYATLKRLFRRTGRDRHDWRSPQSCKPPAAELTTLINGKETLAFPVELIASQANGEIIKTRCNEAWPGAPR
jgi:hypothetical protein